MSGMDRPYSFRDLAYLSILPKTLQPALNGRTFTGFDVSSTRTGILTIPWGGVSWKDSTSVCSTLRRGKSPTSGYPHG